MHAVKRLGLGLVSAAAVVAACSGEQSDLGGNKNAVGDSGSGTGGGSSQTDGGNGGPDGSSGNPVARSSKLDLLLVVDNSSSMADKQEALAVTVPDLVRRLTAPAFGIDDVHVGVITSSLGGHGAPTCIGQDGGTLKQEEADDHAHLLGTRPRAASLNLTDGFVTWTRAMGVASLEDQTKALITKAGEAGCGFESTLESMYRFLVDPKPPVSIEVGPCTAGTGSQCAKPVGVDAELLRQRAAFLRPDSTVAVVVLSDESDCSIRDSQQYFYASDDQIFLPNGSSACATNPNDPCCYSCGFPVPSGCPSPDAACDPGAPRQDGANQINLRCFEQARRFGIDFLYPVERYVNALSKPQLCTSSANLDPTAAVCPDADGDGSPDIVQNPLFQATGGAARTPSMVHVVGIVGVPWQDIRTDIDAEGNPLPAESLRFQTPAQMTSDGTWNVIVGRPTPGGNAPPVPPTDPLMIESVAPRSGDGPSGPLVGYASGPRFGEPGSNAANGHESANEAYNDLQYACIFPLSSGKSKDCPALKAAAPDPSQVFCDCDDAAVSDHDPLCQDAAGGYGYVQYFAKAYPGARHLSLLKGLGESGHVASICARNTDDASRADYGYRPAVDSLIEALSR